MRTLLYEAANVMLTRYKGQLKLKGCGCRTGSPLKPQKNQWSKRSRSAPISGLGRAGADLKILRWANLRRLRRLAPFVRPGERGCRKLDPHVVDGLLDLAPLAKITTADLSRKRR